LTEHPVSEIAFSGHASVLSSQSQRFIERLLGGFVGDETSEEPFLLAQIVLQHPARFIF
jgi:hypothetical protein